MRKAHRNHLRITYDVMKVVSEQYEGILVSVVSRQSNLTHDHVMKVAKLLSKQGLMSIKKQGRYCLLALTLKGRIAYQHIKDFDTLCKEHEIDLL